MGYEGGPIEPFGGWGKRMASGRTCNGVGLSAISIVCKVMMLCISCPTLREIYMIRLGLRKWVRNHGLYTASVCVSDCTTVHKTWTKSGALAWMWLHSRKDAVARQQFSKVTNLFGQRIAVRYYC